MVFLYEFEKLRTAEEEKSYLHRFEISRIHVRWIVIFLVSVISSSYANLPFHVGFFIFLAGLIANFIFFIAAVSANHYFYNKTLSYLSTFFDLLILNTLIYFSGGLRSELFPFVIIYTMMFPMIQIYNTIQNFFITLLIIISFNLTVFLGLGGFFIQNNLLIKDLLILFSYLIGVFFLSETSFAHQLLIKDFERLKEIDVKKSLLISNVSHEMRTPLTSIMGFSQTLLKNENLPDETRREFLQIIRTESDRLTRLIDGLLDLSRIESGFLDLKKAEYNLNELVNDVVNLVKPSVEAKEIEIKTLLPAEPVSVSVDSDRFKQVLTNLLSNSIKYTRNKGKIFVSLSDKVGQAVVSVKDTGIGIPKIDMPFIFDKFYRVERDEEDDQEKGTGLGLSIVKHIIEAHGGTVSVKSEVDAGSEFSIVLPK